MQCVMLSNAQELGSWVYLVLKMVLVTISIALIQLLLENKDVG